MAEAPSAEAVAAGLCAAVQGISPEDAARMGRSLTTPGPYALGPDSRFVTGAPRGEVAAFRWTESRVYPGTGRDAWLYRPAGLDAGRAADLIVFTDGHRYLDEAVNAPAVLDNLISRGELPPIAALFVSPGDVGPGLPIWGGTDNRSLEYDTLNGDYARFLVDELIPHVERTQRVTGDPAGRAIAGLSSGGLCAFNAAWERPDAFGLVLSHCGSFTAIRGGDTMPGRVRQAERKAIRVWLQDGAADVDVVYGDWPLANRAMASALAYAGYDHRFDFGEGGHNLAHGAATLPDALRWLWRDRRSAAATM